MRFACLRTTLSDIGDIECIRKTEIVSPEIHRTDTSDGGGGSGQLIMDMHARKIFQYIYVFLLWRIICKKFNELAKTHRKTLVIGDRLHR